ncbi:MAG TPA: hypothetical protein VFQ92_02245 [Blastocatellia bacterium]|nr:hypothetical protein [Blastocatellia bacterium]
MSRTYLKVLTLALALAIAVAPVAGQSRKRPARGSQKQLTEQIEKSRVEVIIKANEYKESLENVLSLLEPELKEKTEKVERCRTLIVDGLASKKELEKYEYELASVQARIADARKQMGEADHLIAEVKAAEQLEKLAPAPGGAYTATAALIRFNGPSQWAVSDVIKVESFFVSRFGRALPVSALGQTSVHDRMGFDHRNSIDVAVHPDSAEGQAIVAYLRSAGISFIAFRSAVPGSATGAHIHIGYPSRRILR